MVRLIAFVDTFLTIITHTEVVVDGIATAADSQEMVLLATVLGYQVGPVGRTAIGQHLLHHVVAGTDILAQQTLLQHSTANLIDGVSRTLGGCCRAVTGIGQELHETEVVELLSGHELRHTGGLRPAVISVVADGRL